MTSKAQKTKPAATNKKDASTPMTLEQATVFLKKHGEWESVWKLDREVIINWAMYLKSSNLKNE